ncbi:hypothetical protein ACQKCU_24630 [Heyndrickxia sporothermodurans]
MIEYTITEKESAAKIGFNKVLSLSFLIFLAISTQLKMKIKQKIGDK